MKQTKFEKVNRALMDKTQNTGNWLRISTVTDSRHKGKKYCTQNVITGNNTYDAFNTLKEIIKAFELDIK